MTHHSRPHFLRRLGLLRFQIRLYWLLLVFFQALVVSALVAMVGLVTVRVLFASFDDRSLLMLAMGAGLSWLIGRAILAPKLPLTRVALIADQSHGSSELFLTAVHVQESLKNQDPKGFQRQILQEANEKASLLRFAFLPRQPLLPRLGWGISATVVALAVANFLPFLDFVGQGELRAEAQRTREVLQTEARRLEQIARELELPTPPATPSGDGETTPPTTRDAAEAIEALRRALQDQRQPLEAREALAQLSSVTDRLEQQRQEAQAQGQVSLERQTAQSGQTPQEARRTAGMERALRRGDLETAEEELDRALNTAGLAPDPEMARDQAQSLAGELRDLARRMQGAQGLAQAMESLAQALENNDSNGVNSGRQQFAEAARALQAVQQEARRLAQALEALQGTRENLAEAARGNQDGGDRRQANAAETTGGAEGADGTEESGGENADSSSSNSSQPGATRTQGATSGFNQAMGDGSAPQEASSAEGSGADSFATSGGFSDQFGVGDTSGSSPNGGQSGQSGAGGSQQAGASNPSGTSASGQQGGQQGSQQGTSSSQGGEQEGQQNQEGERGQEESAENGNEGQQQMASASEGGQGTSGQSGARSSQGRQSDGQQASAGPSSGGGQISGASGPSGSSSSSPITQAGVGTTNLDESNGRARPPGMAPSENRQLSGRTSDWTEEFVRLYNPRVNEVQGRQEQARARMGEGEFSGSTDVAGSQRRETARTQATRAFMDWRETNRQSQAVEAIPRGYRDLVKSYFDSIEPPPAVGPSGSKLPATTPGRPAAQ